MMKVNKPSRFPALALLAAMASFTPLVQAFEPPAAPKVASPAAAPADLQRTYRVELTGMAAGTMKVSQKTVGDAILSQSDMSFRIKRGELEIAIELNSTFEETLDHRPIRMSSIQKLGAMPIETRTTFNGDSVTIVTIQGKQQSERTQPLTDKDWLTPAASAKQLADAIANLTDAPAADIVTRTIDPSNGPAIFTQTRRGLQKATLELNGKSIPAYKSTTTNSVMPGLEAVEWIDATGLPIVTDTKLGGIPIRMVLESEATPASSSKTDVPEMMLSTFVKPDGIINNPRNTSRSSLLLSVAEGSLAELPSVGAQTFERIDPAHARVRVVVSEPSKATDEEVSSGLFLQSSTMLDAKNDRIKALAQEALTGAPADPAQRAERIRRFVHSYIRAKNLGVGFASATEVAQTREGDCTEHGVLLAATLRAAGIPARVVSGLIYADSFAGQQQIFGYHMWSQAMLKDASGTWRWVDLDATLGDSTPFDATHITIGVSSLADGEELQTMSSLVSVLGRLQIKVESAQ
jgi:hypothetical protein